MKYFSVYLSTYIIFSPLKPIILNRRRGKHNNMSRNIFIFNFIDNMLRINQTIEYQITFSIAVE